MRVGVQRKDRTWYSPEGDTLKMRFIEVGRLDEMLGSSIHVAGFDEAGNWPDRRQSTSCGRDYVLRMGALQTSSDGESRWCRAGLDQSALHRSCAAR